MLSDWQQNFFCRIMPNIAGSPLSQGESLYANSIQSGLLTSLKACYPASVHFIGEECFEILMQDYLEGIKNYPPHIAALAEGVSDFAKQHPIDSQVPALSELLHFEYLWHCAFNAALPEPMQATTLHALNQQGEDCLLRQSRGYFYAAFKFTIHSLWHYCTQGKRNQLPLSEQATGCLLYRDGLSVMHQAASVESLRLLAFFDGKRRLKDVLHLAGDDGFKKQLPVLLHHGLLVINGE